MEIVLYASDSSMGDTTTSQCDKFREWAESELKKEYPNHNITVSSEDSLTICYTDDIDNEDEIADFCSHLQGRCPWTW